MIEKPKYINQAIVLIGFSLLIGVGKMAFDQKHLMSLGPIEGVVFSFVSVILILTIFTYKIWLGRNWARIILTVFYALGLYPFIKELPVEAQRSLIVVFGSISQIVLQLAAIILIFLPASSDWFKSINKNSIGQSH